MWLLFVPVCLAIFTSPLTSASEPHYFITVPTNLPQGAEEKACVTFHDLTGEVDIKLELKKDDEAHTIAEHKIDAHENHDHFQCYPIKVPVRKEAYEQWLFHVTAHGDHLNVDESNKVFLIKKDACIIQADKFIYKPGDIVRFRLISMNLEFNSIDKTFPLVHILNPNKHRIVQWLNVTTENGFAELSFHLADEVMLGEYLIISPSFCKKQFTVEEYVLKRFEVDINAPSVIAVTDKSLHLEICGRYTYGKPVEGSMDITVYPKDRWSTTDPSSEDTKENDSVKIWNGKTDSKGCITKDINPGIFNFSKSASYQALGIKASLTEDQTGHVEQATAQVNVNTHKQISFSKEMFFYHKGVPYRSKLTVTDEKDQPVPNKAVYLYVKGENEESDSKPEKNLLTNEKGIAHFSLDTSTWDSTVALKATLSPIHDDDDDDKNDEDRYSEAENRIGPFYSESESHISIQGKGLEVECDSDPTVTVEYDIHKKTLHSATDHINFYYVLRSLHEIIWYKEHKVNIKDQLNNPIIHGTFSLSFHVDADLFPFAGLIVFAVLPNGETIANALPYTVPLCEKAKVELKFSEEQVRPGESVNLEVSTSAGSLCSIRSLDKGYLLQKPDGKSLLSDLSEELRSVLYELSHITLWREDESDQQCPEHQTIVPETSYIFDVNMIFKMMNLNVITNTKIKKPVQCVERGPAARSGVKVKKPGDKKTPSHFTRRDFPDIWLFDLVPVGSDGHAVVNRKTPHSVTKWVTDAFCLGKNGFAAVSNVELTTFQPYFIDLIVPYSVVQGERFTLRAVVFSYVQKCILIAVALQDSEDLAAVKNKEQARCVCEGHSHSFTWDVTALKLKTLNIHVHSGSIELDGKCTEDNLLINKQQREDSVEKTILVKARGREEEKIQTFLIYPPEDKEDIHITLALPERFVKGSERAHMLIMGDLMANAVFNLEDIFYLPDGCGEQNIAKMSRYLYTMDYLDNTNELTPERKANIVEALVKGYQKQLTFRSDIGTYGSFQDDDNINFWITALVVKTFSHAQNWIHIDENDIQQAVKWLHKIQSPDGCFQDQSVYFNNRLEADNDMARTAYALIALLEHKRPYNGSIVEDALSCLRKSTDHDTSSYTQALMAYAFTLSGDHELRDKMLKKLDEKAIKKEGSRYWETEQHVETGSYIILALLSDKATTTKNLGKIVDIIHWIVSLQNRYGGFDSSQDTALGLQALALYAKLIKNKKGDSTVTIRSKSGFEKIVHVDKVNGLLLQTVDLPEVPGEYTVHATGEGYVSFQSHVHYNAPPEKGEFSLKVTTEPSVCSQESQRRFDVHVEVSYSGKRKCTNMVVVLIEPLSGYVPDKNSLKELEQNPAVSRTEVSAKKISIYMNKLTHETESFTFSLEQETIVENLQPATIVVSDYYDPAEHAGVEYYAPCSGVVAHCEVSAEERADCGHPGITEEQCVERGCCYNAMVHGSKWCFAKGFKKIEKQ
ncbi:pregnancy zone protein-like isoform X2 [Engystomops pustulosus]|uniref:pregnancy zone protein-like isoform X2 n=1 Tax=Engystomops pustulosus TaxID=76066 RepID=UPI003AFB599A